MKNYEYIGTTKNSEYEDAMVYLHEYLPKAYDRIDNHVTVLETRLRESRGLAKYQKGKLDANATEKERIKAIVSLINTIEEELSTFGTIRSDLRLRLAELKSELNTLVGL